MDNPDEIIYIRKKDIAPYINSPYINNDYVLEMLSLLYGRPPGHLEGYLDDDVFVVDIPENQLRTLKYCLLPAGEQYDSYGKKYILRFNHINGETVSFVNKWRHLFPVIRNEYCGYKMIHIYFPKFPFVKIVRYVFLISIYVLPNGIAISNPLSRSNLNISSSLLTPILYGSGSYCASIRQIGNVSAIHRMKSSGLLRYGNTEKQIAIS